jgi:FAD/FMN-containing dehydrogenase
MYDEDRPEAWDAMNSLWKKWNKRIVEWGGAPYHIGLAFGRPLVHRWSEPYYTCIRSIKRALDPNNIMNPGMFEKLSQDFGKE